MINLDLYKIKKELESGKSIFSLNLRSVYYARVSTDKNEQASSLENQIKYFEDFIKSNKNWTFCGGYVDEGISGAGVEKRKNFLKMIDDAKNGKFDLIITKEISRFSRNTLDSIKYTQKLLKYGVGVYFQSDNINTLMPESELRLTIMAGIAQDELRRISERVKFGLSQSVKDGKMLGDAPFGYTKKNGRLEINEKEAQTVRKIFELYEKGLGIRSISKFLEQNGILNSSKKPFTFSSIRNIISNIKYKGYYCGNKYYSIDFKYGKKQKNNKNDWIIYKDEQIPQIVDEKIWNRANEILADRSDSFKKHGSSYSNRYFFSGKIICKNHGVSYHRSVYNNKTELYKCSQSRNGCKNIAVYTCELETILGKIYLFLKKNRKAFARYFEKFLENHSGGERFKELSNKKDKLFELVSGGFITNKEFKERNDKINEELSKLESKNYSFNSEKFLSDSFSFKSSHIKIKKITVEKTAPHRATLTIYITIERKENYCIPLHEIPISCATSICVFPLKNLKFIMCFSLSLSFFIASLSEISSIQLSSKLFSSLTWSIT